MCTGKIKWQNEQVKNWLWRYRDAKRECKRLEGEYNELVESQESAKAIEYSGMPTVSNSGADLSDMMARRSDYLTKIIKCHKRMETILFEISGALDQLEGQTTRDIMSMRYLQLEGTRALNWKEVADKIGFTEQYVCQLHGVALKKIFEILERT